MATGGSPRLLLLTDDAMDRHAQPGHPEGPTRRMAAVAGVEHAAKARGLELGRPTVDEASRGDLLRVHDARYLDQLEAWEAAGGGQLDTDTYLVRGSVRAARLAAGAALAGVAAVQRGEATVAVAAVRPPGHHAAADRGKGFCLLNSVAVAAAWLRSVGVGRVAIVDWDAHHGDGTAALVAADPTIGYFSTHSRGLYPGTGSAAEVGIGAGRGTTWNRPLAPGSGDAEFVAAWRDDLLPALAAFRPGAIIISAGFDPAVSDPLADLEVTAAGFEAIARAVGELAFAVGLGGVTVALEGGYDLDALRNGMSATVGGLLDGLA